jgi:hypothetical protein
MHGEHNVTFFMLSVCYFLYVVGAFNNCHSDIDIEGKGKGTVLPRTGHEGPD